MLENVAKIQRVVLACGAVDLRKGIDGLAMIIGDRYNQNPFEKGTLFLFCGREMVSFCCTNVLKQVHCHGQEILRKLLRLQKNSIIIS